MIQSMTGYGEAQQARDGVSYALEIRSLNNRYFKAAIKLPEYLQFFETDVERLLRGRLQRGSVAFVLRVRNSGTFSTYDVNAPALEHYLRRMGDVALPPGISATVDLGTLLALPGVCQPPELDDEAKARYWEIIAQLTREALDKLVAMRRQEGEALVQDLTGQCRRVQHLLDEVASRAPSVPQEYQQKLRERTTQLLADVKLEVDADAVLRELAIYADRCDINEEIARLGSHLDQFAALCTGDEHAGRTLEFLAQEMLREVNTIGSKSNDAQIARRVVEMKGCIDRLKEQVQNVE